MDPHRRRCVGGAAFLSLALPFVGIAALQFSSRGFDVWLVAISDTWCVNMHRPACLRGLSLRSMLIVEISDSHHRIYGYPFRRDEATLTQEEPVHRSWATRFHVTPLSFNQARYFNDRWQCRKFRSRGTQGEWPVVVDFWAEWCAPCRHVIAPALDEIAGTMGDKVKIVKFNVDENPKTATKYGVMSVPTLMIFKGGGMAFRQVGAIPKAKLQQRIAAAV